MPGAGLAEIYFIAAMMILIVVLCVGAVFIFIRTYRREMKEKLDAVEAKRAKEVSPETNT
jgi:hypothetical protein